MNVTTFEDYVKYVPNLTQAGEGPGQNSIFMRGLSTSAGGVQGSGATESFPNVAIYLDEQSGQVPGRNLDIYAADLERVEILEGPQGTLFGEQLGEPLRRRRARPAIATRPAHFGPITNGPLTRVTKFG